MKSKSYRLFRPFSLKPGKLFQTMVLGFALLLMGCQKEKDYTTGGVTGFITAVDKYAQFCEDMSEVKVTIADCSAYTNSEGKYQIDDVPVGTHTMKYTKDGYSSDSCRVTITPGEIPVFNYNMIFMAEKPDVTITGMNISVAKDKIILKGTLSQSYSVARFFVFIRNSPDVSYNNYYLRGSDFYWWIYRDHAYGEITEMVYYGDFEKEIYINESEGYMSGTSAYVAIYIANPFYVNESALVSVWPVTKVN